MQGQLDSPLTALGTKQARNAGKFLRSRISSDSTLNIISSPLGRALHTAEIICHELGFDMDAICHEAKLMEANHGGWSGLTKADVKRKFPQEFADRKSDRWNFRFPGGESYTDLSKRAEEWCSKGAATGIITLVVTHEMMSRCIRGHFLGLDNKSTLQLSHPHNYVYALESGNIEEYGLPEIASLTPDHYTNLDGHSP